MTKIGNKKLETIHQRVAKIRGRFLETERSNRVQKSIEHLYESRIAAICEGNKLEARGLMLIGATGSGKTTAINGAFRALKLRPSNDPEQVVDYVSLAIPSPTTLKFVGQATLNALGYPLSRDRTAPYIWQLVRHHLKERRVKILHYDEAHDLYTSSSDRELQYIVNTFKTLLQDRDWPVAIVLSGTGQLNQLLEYDKQLTRRFTVLRNEPLEAKKDQRELIEYLLAYSKIAELAVSPELERLSFGKTHIMASAGAFGFAIELIIDAIEQALLADSSEIRISDFANSYSRKTGCLVHENPYLISEPI